jgi:hypothetical protein
LEISAPSSGERSYIPQDTAGGIVWVNKRRCLLLDHQPPKKHGQHLQDPQISAALVLTGENGALALWRTNSVSADSSCGSSIGASSSTLLEHNVTPQEPKGDGETKREREEWNEAVRWH